MHLDIITDAGVSGGKPLASREGGQRLLDAIKARRAEAVVMLKLDRMFRNAGDCLATIETWDRAGVALHRIGTQAPVGEGHPLDQPVQLHLPGLAL